mmetsp:Transcript_95189/g.269421  ORF Transcript_95189/g.269421 Transcript_95189/m.269421 type:complete len:336 (+) Transcript_95189:100-1107(+)
MVPRRAASTCAWAVALLPSLLCVCTADDGHGFDTAEDKTEDKQIAHCVIDVVHASLMLGDAATAINSAVKGCHGEGSAGETRRQRATCATPVVAVIEFLSYTASFLAGASGQCARAMNMTSMFTQLGFGEVLATVAEQEKCARSITHLIAGLSQLSSAATALSTDCTAGGPPQFDFGGRLRLLQEATPEHGDSARLPALGLPDAVESRKQSEAECAFDIGQTTLFLARAGGAINGAVHDCSDISLFQQDRAYRADCAVAISGVIASFSYAASTISFAVSKCPLVSDTNRNALCAGGVFKLISSLSAIATNGAAFQTTCYSGVHPPPTTTSAFNLV